MMDINQILERWKGSLIVSCQAGDDSPLAAPDIIAALALTAQMNGAAGVRIDGPANLAAVRKQVSIPILGIEKLLLPGGDDSSSKVYITPTYAAASRVAKSGADVVAMDGTQRTRPHHETLASIISRVHAQLDCSVMADVATLDEGIASAESCGADLLGTTLSGYTRETQSRPRRPDFDLIEALASRLNVPVLCEGNVRDLEDVRRAFECGAFAVVVGKAITGVDWLVRRYVSATPSATLQTSTPALVLGTTSPGKNE